MALSAEPDKLDPTLARTLVGRSVFNAICEKLYDVDAKLTIVPQLAAALPEFSADGLTVTIKIRNGVKFADGTALDAAAVKTSLDRHRTLAGSARASELSSVADVQVVDPATIAIKLKVPFTPLTAVLADRFRGKYSPACGPISPASPFSSDAAQACPKHDPAAAKALLTAAGVTMPVKTSMVIGKRPTPGASARRSRHRSRRRLRPGAATRRVRGVADPDRCGQVSDLPDRLVRPCRSGRQHRQLRAYQWISEHLRLRGRRRGLVD